VLPIPLTAVAVALLAQGNEDRVGAFGLITAPNPAAWLLVAALVVLYVLELSGRARTLVLGQILVGVVVILYGAPALVETEPRFATAYAHAGFVEYIARTGHPLANFDARFYWPGFFAAGATLIRLAGLDSALPLLAWTPVVMELLYLPPLVLIGRSLVSDPRVRALGILVFYLCNWVGQDYFAPQAVAFLLYLVVIGMLLRWFRPAPANPADAPPSGFPARLAALPSRTLRFLAPDERSPPPPPAWVVRALHATIVLLAIAMTVSHQLTPFALGIVAAVLVFFRLCRLRSFPMFLAVLVLGWLSFAASDFWVGHLKDVTGSVGDVGGNVASNVGNRIGGSETHLIVLRIRLLVTGALWGAAAWTVLRPARRRWAHRGVVVLAVAPFPVLMLNSYGGEALLRVFLYSLPFVSLLAAEALWRPGWRPGARRLAPRLKALTASALVLLVGLFPVARYGNERYEMVRPGDISALTYIYDQAPRSATLLSLAGSLPWRYRDVEKFEYGNALPYLDPVDVAGLERRLRADPDGAFLVITTSQIYEAIDTQGYNQAWADQMIDALHSAPGLEVVYETDSAFVVAPVPEAQPGRAAK
jgi:hypothetical protein